MSGIKPIDLSNFYRSIHSRELNGERLTLDVLAAAIFSGPTHLSAVFSGQRPGKPTWRRLEKSGLLIDKEWQLLGRTPPVPQPNVPRETNSHMGTFKGRAA